MKIIHVNVPNKFHDDLNATRAAADKAVADLRAAVTRGAQSIVVLRVGDAKSGWIPTVEAGASFQAAFVEAMSRFPQISDPADGTHVEVVLVPYFVKASVLEGAFEGVFSSASSPASTPVG